MTKTVALTWDTFDERKAQLLGEDLRTIGQGRAADLIALLEGLLVSRLCREGSLSRYMTEERLMHVRHAVWVADQATFELRHAQLEAALGTDDGTQDSLDRLLGIMRGHTAALTAVLQHA